MYYHSDVEEDRFVGVDRGGVSHTTRSVLKVRKEIYLVTHVPLL